MNRKQILERFDLIARRRVALTTAEQAAFDRGLAVKLSL